MDTTQGNSRTHRKVTTAITLIDYIYDQKGPQHDLFLLLHNFIMKYSGVRAEVKYKIPFYSVKKPICYIRPQKKGLEGVEVVFWNGVKMKNSLPCLIMKKREWFGGITYKTVDDINFELLDQIIQEGLMVDGPLQLKKYNR